MNPAAQLTHAGQLADDLALRLGRTAFPRKPHGTQSAAANDAEYGAMRAWSIKQKLGNGMARTVRVIASSAITAELAAFETLPEIGEFA